MINLAQFLHQFGVIAYVMIAGSVIIVAISIERLITLLLQPKLPLKKADKLHQDYAKGDISKDNYLKMLYQLSHNKELKRCFNYLSDEDRNLAKTRASSYLQQKRQQLQRPLLWLNFFAVGSPMLGLLGTIWSMSHSFSALAQSLAGDGLGKMIQYLSEAMFATAFGIVLALMSMFALYLLRQLTEKYLNRYEAFLNQLFCDVESLTKTDQLLKSLTQDTKMSKAKKIEKVEDDFKSFSTSN
ncbi:MotA/TolQ/ExbB proton channel family protein [Fangia hongkongensis]|uniref:MotA/TolQ/ExbB proton channel family protein n=1 Tax=Fangia hongkongensis TaxID=270495 RepID=UPI000373CE9D|nr:MotA/TolQ/ExbB proton channel family protein [Fangia hongkongensis]MBK2125066.1 MotA/TolQ/ExbB proton channel family protein [Fangia hongkongensis]